MKKLLISFILLIPSIIFAFSGWKNLATENFTVFYPDGMESEAWNVIQSLEYHRPFVENLIGNKKKKMAVMIEDMGNYVNGYANPVGEKISLFSYTPSDNELSFTEDWWTLVGVHEYIHILQMKKEGGIPKALRSIYGNLLHTNMYHPMWMIEGITVYGESAFSPYSGRMKGGTYPAIISTLAKENKLPSMSKAAYYSYDTPTAHYYVFGGSFYQYLSDTYGQDKFSELYENDGKHLLSYFTPMFPGLGVGRSFRATYRKSLSSLWRGWQLSEKEKAKDFELPDNYLTHNGWHKSDLKVYDGNIYFADTDFFKTPTGNSFLSYSIKKYDPVTKQFEIMHRQYGSYPAGFSIQKNHLYYTDNLIKRGFRNLSSQKWGTEPTLHRKNLTTGKESKIFQGNFRCFEVLPNNTILLALDLQNNEGSILKSIDSQGDENQILISENTITGISENNGSIYLTARRFWHNSSIFLLEDNELRPLIDTPKMEQLNGFDEEGNIIFTANYGEYRRSYLYSIKDKSISELAGSSFMISAAIHKNETFYLSLSKNGYELASSPLQKNKISTPVFTPNPPPFSHIKSTPTENIGLNKQVKKGGYWKNLSHLMVPRILRLPIIEYNTEEELLIGAVLVGSDIVGHFPYWQTTLLYNTETEKTEIDIALENYLLLPLKHSIQYTNSDGQTLISDQSFDLYQSQKWGLQYLGLGTAVTAKDNYNRKYLTPYLDSYFEFFSTRFYNRVYGIYESEKYLHSDRERQGIYNFLSIQQRLFRFADFTSTLNAAYDPDADKTEVFREIRGYTKSLEATQGITIENSLRTTLFHIRGGIWNPNIYFEDVGLNLFFDTALPRKGEGAKMQYAYGAEILFESYTLFILPMHFGIRTAVNREEKITTNLFFSTNIF